MLNNVKYLTLIRYNEHMDFHEWINKKFVEWRGPLTLREGGSQEKFAEWIGVSPQLMTQWLKRNGRLPTYKRTVDKLVRRFGPEVYEILKIPAPPEFIQKLEAVYDELTPDQRQALKNKIADILDEYSESTE